MPETKQYGIIYADPPWHYDRKHGSGVAENHYPTMSIEEICAHAIKPAIRFPVLFEP